MDYFFISNEDIALIFLTNGGLNADRYRIQLGEQKGDHMRQLLCPLILWMPPRAQGFFFLISNQDRNFFFLSISKKMNVGRYQIR